MLRVKNNGKCDVLLHANGASTTIPPGEEADTSLTLKIADENPVFKALFESGTLSVCEIGQQPVLKGKVDQKPVLNEINDVHPTEEITEEIIKKEKTTPVEK